MVFNENFEIELNNIKNEALTKLTDINKIDLLEIWKQEYLGRKSKFNDLLKLLGKIDSIEQKKFMGELANKIKEVLNQAYENCQQSLYELEITKQIESESIDITLPGLNRKSGHYHPLSLICEAIGDIFQGMGFNQVFGPEVETNYYNFDALNIDFDHPARDEQDTFYTNVAPHVLLRSQTSTVQIRAMEKTNPPLKIISIGRVYRNEEINARKYPIFHQVEGLYVNKNVNFGQLKWTLQKFINLFFERDLKTRFRPDFFPFTEPSAEVDCECPFCETQGCKTCGYKGWLEILGCGMVHPNVLKNIGSNYENAEGFAFGMGVERLAMIKFGINDIRYFYNNDIRFIEQF